MLTINKIKIKQNKTCLFICRTFALSIACQYFHKYFDVALGPTINLCYDYPECIEGWEIIIEDDCYK